jgi:large subunit ribosomal protein L21
MVAGIRISARLSGVAWTAASVAGGHLVLFEDMEETTMFAVIKAQGKQFRVAEGDTLTVDRLTGETGATIALGEVLMLVDGGNTKIGAPIISGAKVTAEIVEHSRGDKIKVFKKRRRKNYHRTRGHRQDLTTVKITAITA